MKKFLKFVEGVFSSDSPESSKRVFGAIGFLCSVVFIAVWGHSLIDELLYISAMLLGLETLTKMFKK